MGAAEVKNPLIRPPKGGVGGVLLDCDDTVSVIFCCCCCR